MKHLMLFSAADGTTFQNLVLHSQLFLDDALCEYLLMQFSQAALAMSAVLQAHKAVKHCPQQWLEAIKEINLYPTKNDEVHACIWAMEHVCDGSGIGIPSHPVVDTAASPPRQVSPQCVADFSSAVASPQGVQETRKRPAMSTSLQRKAAPVKFHSAPQEDALGPALKRPRALSSMEGSSVRA
jgi:hypothetical protein